MPISNLSFATAGPRYGMNPATGTPCSIFLPAWITRGSVIRRLHSMFAGIWAHGYLAMVAAWRSWRAVPAGTVTSSR